MSTDTPTRDDAFRLLKKYNKKEGLIRHALAVESVMAHFARRFNEDEEKWKIIGLEKIILWFFLPEEWVC